MTTALLGDSELTIGVRTVDGRAVGVLACDDTTDLSWTRAVNEVSVCNIVTADAEAEQLIPWLHWIDVWEGDALVWSGPVLKSSTDLGDGITQITARDVAGFMWYTRTPLSGSWSNLDPAPIAYDLWKAMLRLHQVDIEPTVLPPRIVERFSFTTAAESQLLHQVIGRLVQIGLNWTVVAGRPILGTPDDTVVATLTECDIDTSLRRIRSGQRAAFDVRVQGQNWAHTERLTTAGLRLQALLALDDMFGVSNIVSACRQYLREVGAIRDTLEIPPGATLSPEAPVTTEDLVPGRVFALHTDDDLSLLLRLTGVEGSWSGDTHRIRVTFDTITEPVELDSAGGGGL